MATIHNVLKRFTVSVNSTVSPACNSGPHASEDTQARVLTAIDGLGYTPRSYASAMKGKSTKTVARIVFDVSNPCFAFVTCGVEDRFQAAGYSLLLCNADRGRAEQGQYPDRLLVAGASGVIIASARHALSDLGEEGLVYRRMSPRSVSTTCLSLPP